MQNDVNSFDARKEFGLRLRMAKNGDAKIVENSYFLGDC